MLNKKLPVAVATISTAFFLSIGHAAPKPAKAELQELIDDLQEQIDNLQTQITDIPAGANGSDGFDGINCWDLNGDGIGNGSEDSNNDGSYNAVDCQGLARADGADLKAGQCALYQDLSRRNVALIDPPSYCYAVGDVGPAGGFVFYITDGGAHGLEAAPTDQEVSSFGCIGEALSPFFEPDIGSGAQNTANLALCGLAANIASAYTGPDGTTQDWFLPSELELREMQTLYDLGIANLSGESFYWSSTELNADFASATNFGDINADEILPKDALALVRAVRAF